MPPFSYLAAAAVLAFFSAMAGYKFASSGDQTVATQAATTAAAVPAAAPPTAPTVEIDTTSPDAAVKSWWRVLDYRDQITSAQCLEQNVKETPTYFPMFEKLAQEAALRHYTEEERDCAASLYEREIQEVKSESDTRALVFAKIRNVSPIQPGADPSPDDRNKRADGYRFKYLLEKTAAGWKVSQAYRFDYINQKYKLGDPWEKVYSTDTTPEYPYFVYFQ